MSLRGRARHRTRDDGDRCRGEGRMFSQIRRKGARKGVAESGAMMNIARTVACAPLPGSGVIGVRGGRAGYDCAHDG